MEFINTNNNTNNQIIDDETKRIGVLNEIFQSEETYCASLDRLINNYLEPAINENIVKKEDIWILFSNSLAIREQSKRFVTAMRLEIERGSLNYAQSFMDTISYPPYLVYVVDYQQSLQRLEKLKTQSTTFKEFLQRRKNVAIQQGEAFALDLESYLIMPVSRYPRYLLLINDLLRYSPLPHPHHQHIKQASDQIKYDLKVMNDQLKEMTDDNKLTSNSQNNCTIM
ncbi:hypothetical protein DFA_05660 [Cavenderia fasciculata]|uniref:DH domain-containing protein n=1 Tax=Cavenderia fasciculata TaxID=261658 RepID=F4PLX3_CACFS|nr:uncharacterized protein DFA_05660 [Cavenderia fasciculata]EGG23527.1 hypothetical protein DFA_05660 [Cavenderia fasciculata]|eukprot:XP_004361378.1 hypothetical protein DFA_05660 [Cavenderia fasciculata]